MTKDNWQKVKLLKMMDLLRTDSSPEHPLTTDTISRRLAVEGISVDKKLVSKEMAALRNFGYDVYVKQIGHEKAYYVTHLPTDDDTVVKYFRLNLERGIAHLGGAELQKKEVLFHVDATQSGGKLVDEFKTLKYNMLSFSAHKLRGPQGIGALILRKKAYKLPPVKAIMYGGPQEH